MDQKVNKNYRLKTYHSVSHFLIFIEEKDGHNWINLYAKVLHYGVNEGITFSYGWNVAYPYIVNIWYLLE